MKKNLLFFWLIFTTTIYSQTNIVFCPPGAEWKYLYFKPNSSSQPYISPKIRWISDTTINGEQLKTLYADVFFIYDNVLCSHWIYTKQIGDTVFMKSCYTQNQWEILYNFAALPGEHWETTIKDAYYSGAPLITHTITVDSIGTEVLNGFNLKKLYVNTCYNAESHLTCFNHTITERIGDSGFLFNYYKKIYSVEYDIWQDFLCYQDNNFSPTSFSNSNRDCNYTFNVGLRTYELDMYLTVSPNPFSNAISVEFLKDSYHLSVKNELGQIIMEGDYENAKLELACDHLSKGIYLLEISTNGLPVARRKIIKI